MLWVLLNTPSKQHSNTVQNWVFLQVNKKHHILCRVQAHELSWAPAVCMVWLTRILPQWKTENIFNIAITACAFMCGGKKKHTCTSYKKVQKLDAFLYSHSLFSICFNLFFLFHASCSFQPAQCTSALRYKVYFPWGELMWRHLTHFPYDPLAFI